MLLRIGIQLCDISKETGKLNSLNGSFEGRSGPTMATCATQYNFHPEMFSLEVREACFSKMYDFIIF